MTLLVAVRAADGLAVVSDRKETYANRSPKDVKKYHMDKRGRFYISLSGDGRLAKGVLDRIARARTGPADVVGRIRRTAKHLYTESMQSGLRVDGFLVIADRDSLNLYNITIIDGHVDVAENRDGVSVQGDARAQSLCRYIASKVDVSHMPCKAAAERLHVLAADVAELVPSVGTRGRYGFDLGLFFAAGGTKLAEQHTERLGWIDMQIRLTDHADPFATHGGSAQ